MLYLFCGGNGDTVVQKWNNPRVCPMFSIVCKVNMSY